MKLRKFLKKCVTFFKSSILFPENKELQEMFSSYTKCYVLGSSPTINKLDLTKLEKDSLKISMGNFYEHPEINLIKPDIHIFAASHPPITKKVLVNWWTRCNNKLPQKTILLLEIKDKLVAEKVFKNRKIFYYSYNGNFPIDFRKRIVNPSSVTSIGLQLGIFCKIEEIICLGITHNWYSVDPYLHFYDHEGPSLEYYLKKENIKVDYHNLKIRKSKESLYNQYRLFKSYEKLNEVAKANSIKIINGDIYSEFDAFELVNKIE